MIACVLLVASNLSWVNLLSISRIFRAPLKTLKQTTTTAFAMGAKSASETARRLEDVALRGASQPSRTPSATVLMAFQVCRSPWKHSRSMPDIGVRRRTHQPSYRAGTRTLASVGSLTRKTTVTVPTEDHVSFDIGFAIPIKHA